MVVAELASFGAGYFGWHGRRHGVDVENTFWHANADLLGPYRTLHCWILLTIWQEYRHLFRRWQSHKLGPSNRRRSMETNRSRYHPPSESYLKIDARFEAGALMSLAINPTSTVVAVGGTDGMIKLVNLNHGNILATLGAQTGDSIESLVWATTLPILAAGCVDGRIYLYDTQTYRLRNTLSHEDAVTAITLPTGSFELTSVSIDKSVRRWDIRTGQEIARRTGHHDAIVGGLALSKDGKKVVTGGDDTVALVWGFE
jgi:WD40 repeat protein